MITSRRNRWLKDIRRLRRSKGDRVLLEGPHLVAEAAGLGLPLSAVLATPSFLAGGDARTLLPLLDRPPLEIAPELLAEVTDADSPRGILAVAELPRAGIDALTAGAGVYVYADAIQDPGNLGALARVAEASGVAGLALAPGSVHPNHPRAQRAAAGSLLRLPVAVTVTAQAVDEHLAPLSPTWAALVPHGGDDLWTAELEGTVVLALGAEGPGLSPTVAERCTRRLSVPTAGAVESLNVTTAAAVVLFELRRRAIGC